MNNQLQQFICPIDRCCREFNVQLQLFAHRVSFLACLHTGGKITTGEVCEQLINSWQQLQSHFSPVADSYERMPAAPTAALDNTD